MTYDPEADALALLGVPIAGDLAALAPALRRIHAARAELGALARVAARDDASARRRAELTAGLQRDRLVAHRSLGQIDRYLRAMTALYDELTRDWSPPPSDAPLGGRRG